MKPLSTATTLLLPDRFTFTEVAGPDLDMAFRSDVLSGLSELPKNIPPVYFYDETGSQLFEAITRLPEYYLTRSEQEILEKHSETILRAVGSPTEIVEFGSGSSKKTRLLIEAALSQRSELLYIPIDISGSFLKQTAERLVADHPRLSVHAIAAEYLTALDVLPPPGGARLFLFMGSSIGNLERKQAISFLKQIRLACRPEDRLLIGADLVKDAVVIEAAYNDRQGITESFNKNLLMRMNRELGADFDVSRFRHAAPYLSGESMIEMRLVSTADQSVTIPELYRSFDFANGEALIPPSTAPNTRLKRSNKWAVRAEFQVSRFWFDERDWFTVGLLEPI